MAGITICHHCHHRHHDRHHRHQWWHSVTTSTNTTNITIITIITITIITIITIPSTPPALPSASNLAAGPPQPGRDKPVSDFHTTMSAVPLHCELYQELRKLDKLRRESDNLVKNINSLLTQIKDNGSTTVTSTRTLDKLRVAYADLSENYAAEAMYVPSLPSSPLFPPTHSLHSH